VQLEINIHGLSQSKILILKLKYSYQINGFKTYILLMLIPLKVGPKIAKSKHVKVQIEKQLLKAQVMNESNTWESLIDDKLPWKIRTEESTWSLLPGDHIHVSIGFQNVFSQNIDSRVFIKLLILRLILKNLKKDGGKIY
jgi:hypothetical protein